MSLSLIDASSHPFDSKMMELAIEQSKLADRISTAYSVGAVLSLNQEIISTGYSREFPGNTHAEQVCIEKALKKLNSLQDCVLYSTMEPCGKRLSGNICCADRILHHGLSRVVIGILEPEKFVQGHVGLELLLKHGIQVELLQGFKGILRFILHD